ncbi:Lysine histidine transporter 1 [Vitis vinifera]|uniref:Lysine histidine transporter 1 n=1 Tax=Vitis vinifera TaxID=29760 RepID=A0A438I2D0_VITVI|nr:Lysine histidine transporter 1 [Vitis vinifera]
MADREEPWPTTVTSIALGRGAALRSAQVAESKIILNTVTVALTILNLCLFAVLEIVFVEGGEQIGGAPRFNRLLLCYNVVQCGWSKPASFPRALSASSLFMSSSAIVVGSTVNNKKKQFMKGKKLIMLFSLLALQLTAAVNIINHKCEISSHSWPWLQSSSTFQCLESFIKSCLSFESIAGVSEVDGWLRLVDSHDPQFLPSGAFDLPVTQLLPGQLRFIRVSTQMCSIHTQLRPTTGRVFTFFSTLGDVAFVYAGHNVVLEIQATIPSTPEKPSRDPCGKSVADNILITLE